MPKHFTNEVSVFKYQSTSMKFKQLIKIAGFFLILLSMTTSNYHKQLGCMGS
uniref:Uncharacterized protein n=1 Tax=Populus trichocarpa TaxID=3694 RepID=A0A3N7G4J2_POPTR